MEDRFFLGIKGHVVCFDKATGKELWRKKLRTAHITNIHVNAPLILVYARGHLFALSIHDGSQLWHNELPGLGFGPAIFGTTQQDSSMVYSIAAQQAAQAGASGGGGGA